MKNSRGSILAVVIIFIFIFTLMGMFAMRLVILQNETSDSELYYTRAHFAALYASDLALFHIMQWENIATSGTVHTDGRKFLAEDQRCFFYSTSSKEWYPLKALQDSNLIETFSDSITGGADSGIRIYCYVVEEDSKTLNSNDGFIPDMSPTTLTGQYGTYKFYVIKSSAVIYSDYKNSMGEIAAAKDELHFFIAYSSGPVGARGYENITEADGTVVQGLRLLPGGLGVSTPEYIKSAPNRSFLTGKVLPIFRYYIRGRR